MQKQDNQISFAIKILKHLIMEETGKSLYELGYRPEHFTEMATQLLNHKLVYFKTETNTKILNESDLDSFTKGILGQERTPFFTQEKKMLTTLDHMPRITFFPDGNGMITGCSLS